MIKCKCGKKFKNKAGLSSHKNWCDGSGLASSDNKSIKGIETEKLCSYGCGNKANWRLANDKVCCSKRALSCPNVHNKSISYESVQTENLCEYGCDRVAKYKLSTGKFCCSIHYNKCIAKRQKDSESKIGKSYEELYGGKKPGAFKPGCDPWNKRSSYTKLKSEKWSKEHRRNLSEINSGRNRSSEEIKNIKKGLEKAKANSKNVGGYRKGGGHSKGSWYYSDIAGKVYLDSSYEIKYARHLDKNNVKWKRNNKKFPYTHNGEERNYIPDFYLIEKESYVEIKGYKTERDKSKWKHFPKKLIVLYKEDLQSLGCNI
jgi:hypothetical protein